MKIERDWRFIDRKQCKLISPLEFYLRSWSYPNLFNKILRFWSESLDRFSRDSPWYVTRLTWRYHIHICYIKDDEDMIICSPFPRSMCLGMKTGVLTVFIYSIMKYFLYFRRFMLKLVANNIIPTLIYPLAVINICCSYQHLLILPA